VHPSRASRAIVAVTTASSLALSTFAFWWASDARDTARRARSAVGRLDRRVGETHKDASRVSAAASALGRRVSAVEARLAAEPDPAAVAGAVAKSVFTIEADNGLGSGFVMRATAGSSSLLTNFHVVADGWVNGVRTVRVRQGDRTYEGHVTSVAPADDLAIVEVATAFPSLARAEAEPAVGDPVLVVGSPLGLGGTVAAGIVSAFRTEDGVRYLQFSAPISPGNSGGPVVDRFGRVVGVATAKAVAPGAEGLSFAIPISRACSAFPEIC
jgi:putative serine protease PepD